MSSIVAASVSDHSSSKLVLTNVTTNHLVSNNTSKIYLQSTTIPVHLIDNSMFRMKRVASITTVNTAAAPIARREPQYGRGAVGIRGMHSPKPANEEKIKKSSVYRKDCDHSLSTSSNSVTHSLSDVSALPHLPSNHLADTREQISQITNRNDPECEHNNSPPGKRKVSEKKHSKIKSSWGLHLDEQKHHRY